MRMAIVGVLCISVGSVIFGHVIFLVAVAQLVFSSESLVDLKVFGSGEVTDKSGVCCNSATFFDDELQSC